MDEVANRAERLHRGGDLFRRGPTETEAGERLRRLAEELTFSHYVVCPFCFSPIVIFDAEVEAFDTTECGHCQAVVRRDRVELHAYHRKDRHSQSVPA